MMTTQKAVIARAKMCETNLDRATSHFVVLRLVMHSHTCKIHLWRQSIVLALHYFQGMACYRSATLLEVMDTRSFWIIFIFSRVIYRRSCISEVHSNNSCFSINKKKSVATARLEPTPSKTTLDVVFVLSPPLYQLSYHSAEGEGLISDI